MPRLIWSPAALADAQRLYRFLAQKDKPTAQRAIKTIRTNIKILALQPEAGRPVDDMDTEFRQWPINFGNSGNLTLYHYDGIVATILAIRHQREAGFE